MNNGNRSTDSYDNIAEYQSSLLAGVNLQTNVLVLLNAQLSSVFLGEVNVSLSNDAACFGLNGVSVLSSQLDSRCACQISGQSDRSIYAQGTSVCSSQLNLSTFSSRSENCNSLHGSLRSGDGQSFFCNETACDFLLNLQLITCTEQFLDVLLGQVHVASTYFNIYI